MATALTGQQIRDMFTELADDDMSDPQAYIFMNLAKDQIESQRDWNFNRAFDNSKTVAAGDNYLSMKTLPADFFSPRNLFFSGDLIPLISINFDERERYKDVYKRWYIDWVNGQFAVCGAPGAAGRSLDMYYARSTPTITADTSPVWPAQFHPILGFKMTEMFQSAQDNDREGVSFKSSRENLRLYTDLWKAMLAWDSKLKTMTYNDKNARNVDLSTYPDVVGSNFIV